MSVARRGILFLVGVMALGAATGLVRPAFAGDVVTTYAPPVITEEQRLEWERDAIRQGFDFDIARQEDVKAMPCLVRGGCPALVPHKELQFSRVQKILASGHCKDSKELTLFESSFCQLLQTPNRKLLDRFYTDVKNSYPDTKREFVVEDIANALGYVKGGRACQKFVRVAVGKAPSAWTADYYQDIVDCKLLFEGAEKEPLVTDLAYFRLARHDGSKKQCAGIKDADIKAFCQGPFPTPLEDTP